MSILLACCKIESIQFNMYLEAEPTTEAEEQQVFHVAEVAEHVLFSPSTLAPGTSELR